MTAFGPIKDVKALKSKNTELNIQYDDNYLIMLEHKNGTKGVFAVDVIARKPYRHIDVYGEQLQLSWNGTPDSLNEYDIENKQEVNITFEDASEYVEGYATFITENPYREELNAYFKQIVDRNFHPAWDFEKDKVVLDWIDVIEK